MTDPENRLLAELRLLAGRKLHLDYATVCTAFGNIFPAVTGTEQRRRLHTLLTALEVARDIVLPVGKTHYDRIADPPMPRWLRLARTDATPARPEFDPAVFPWVTELRFAAALRNPQQLDVLRRVQEFLASGGASRCLVPVKERSVELFGDEKKLDDLRSSALFRTGRLSLELLRCFQVSPPLVWERGPASLPRPVIVIENHSTWHSFVRWNKDHGAWAAVCYGSGDCFETSAASLGEVVNQVPWDGSLYYFGDLDPKGLLIPIRASRCLEIASLPPIQPHAGCYKRLLARATAIELPAAQPLYLSQECAAWLGPELSPQVQVWFKNGVRLPQELFGYEQLCEDAPPLQS